ncbi:MAG: hypothetical protein HY719_05385, partial [Planctomycetes bacterium]|nr:hypothetical protein [Planctomycetota bacterium]
RLAPVARRPWLDGARLAGDLFPGRLAFLGRPLVGLTPGYRESFELFLFRAKG